MKNSLYRIVYCSRNELHGTTSEVTAELHSILSKARSNNAKEQITGALLYNAGTFAQVLEGSLASIERVFEKIQRDPRHTEVTVIENGRIEEREFPEWAMAFTGSSAEDQIPDATAALRAAFGKVEGSSQLVLAMLRDLVVKEDDWILLRAA